MRNAVPFNRDKLSEYGLDPAIYWDLIVIGGGATGLGTAVDAAARGYKTLLVEQDDFGKATSSRSTKLVHGGVRYLRQGNISLVLRALRERGKLLHNAPHLVQKLPFVIPCYAGWESLYYGLGLKLYDGLAGRLSFGSSSVLNREETTRSLPTAVAAHLRGGVRYYDGQFDDARLIINLAQTCAELGGVPLNYVRAVRLRRQGGRIFGVVVEDVETGAEVELNTRVVVNATGVFVDAIRQLDEEHSPAIIQPSQGIHIVLDRSFLPGNSALMVPRTDDGRVLFAIPWHGRVVFGTTDTPVDRISLEPTPLEHEIDYLLEHAARYLTRVPTRADVLSVFAGLRPLVTSTKTDDTKALVRDHVLRVSKSGLVTITGGKWTTYRRMAEDAVDYAARVAGLEPRPSPTASMHIHGWLNDVDHSEPLAVYGSDRPAVEKLIGETPDGDLPLHESLPCRRGEVVWAVRREMARTVEDVLARRTRALLLDARASVEAASLASRIMAKELNRDEQWARDQVASFRALAESYIPGCDAALSPRHATRTRTARGQPDTAQ